MIVNDVSDDDKSREELLNEIRLLKGEPAEVSYAIKSKTVGIVLAVFFSFFSWLYTYGKSKAKFWSSIVLFIIPYFVARAFDIAILTPILYIAVPLIIWIWAIADNASKPYEFFAKYPIK